MRTLSPTETKALKQIERLYNLNGNNEVSRNDVSQIVNELWMMAVAKDTLLGTMISTLNDCLKLANCRNDFFALVGYDLDLVVQHYQLMSAEEEEW